jgi:hypothetical protein
LEVFLWQYNGTVIKSYRENVFAVIDREDGMHIDDPKAQGLLGDTRFICNIEAEERARLKVENENDVGLTDDDQVRDQIATVSIGEKGAKMLRDYDKVVTAEEFEAKDWQFVMCI